MLHFKKLILFLLIFSQLLPSRAPQAQAAIGQPTLGARIDLNGQYIEMSVEQAAAGLQWLAIDISWAAIMPTAEQYAPSDQLENFLQLAADQGLNVLVGVTEAPTWALTPLGPDPQATSEFIYNLAADYPAIAAFELFPGANTTAGWGVPPHPGAYLAVLQLSKTQLEKLSRPIRLIAGGLTPLTAASDPEDIDELSYLARLYEHNGAVLLPTISLRYLATSSPADQLPTNDQPTTLRRYENIRYQMLQYGHKEGALWITGFSWPTTENFSASEETAWITQAYQMMNAQLYIEISFFNSFNPGPGNHAAMTSPDGLLHPAFSLLLEIANVNRYSRHLSPRSQNVKATQGNQK